MGRHYFVALDMQLASAGLPFSADSPIYPVIECFVTRASTDWFIDSQVVSGYAEHEEGVHNQMAQGTGPGSMHAASPHAVSTTTLSSHATGTTNSGDLMSATIGVSSTDSRQLQLADAARSTHEPPVEPVATTPNHRTPNARVKGGQRDEYTAPLSVGIFLPPEANSSEPVAGTGRHTPPAPQPGAHGGVATKASVSNHGTAAHAALQTFSANASLLVCSLPTSSDTR